MQGEGLHEGEHRPEGGEGDHCEEKIFGDNAGPLALRKALADKAKGAQAQRSSWVGQLTTTCDMAA